MSQAGTYAVTAVAGAVNALDGDAGQANPVLGIITITGGNNIGTAGVADVLTINVTGTTDHGVQVGNAGGSLTSLAVGTDGQVLVGSAGNDPVFANITSGDGTVVVTEGAGTLDLSAPGAGTMTGLDSDAGAAVPVAGVIDILGGNNIGTTGAGAAITVNVTGTTASRVQIGNAGGSLTSLGAMLDGQLVLGSTGADPAVASLTSTGGSLIVTEGAGTLNIDTQLALQTDTGWATWSGAGAYYDDSVLGTFDVLRGGTGYIKGVPITWVPQNIGGMVSGNLYWIYIDNTGTIGITNTRTDALFEDNIVLFECLRDSTPVTNLQHTVREDHPYIMPVDTSNYLHNNVGVIIENVRQGANITLNGTRKIQINGADLLDDHGLKTDIPDSGGVAVNFNKFYTNAGGKWAWQNGTDIFSGYWNNAGTPTALTAGRFGVYTLYVSKDDLNTVTPTYYAVLHTAEFNNFNQARNAISDGTIAQATNELFDLELCQLGFIIYGQAIDWIVQVIISKFTLRAVYTTSGTNIASLITVDAGWFDGVLSAADSNVQAALDTLDDWSAWNEINAGAFNILNNTNYIIDNVGLSTGTLPVTAEVGQTISIVGKSATGWSIAQNAGQTIHILGADTTAGAGGSLSSTTRYDCVELICVTADTNWVVKSVMGNLTVV